MVHKHVINANKNQVLVIAVIKIRKVPMLIERMAPTQEPTKPMPLSKLHLKPKPPPNNNKKHFLKESGQKTYKTQVI